jgi:pimeloyl-ACP methyl ester carboxylesterase
MPILRVNNRSIHYWTPTGKQTDQKEILLFVHGAGGGQLTWTYQKAYFEKEFQPILLELPGHGDSGGEGEDRIEAYADHVHAFITKLRLPKIFLVGHSMGGAITQMLALRHPEAFKAITLVGTGARLRVLPLVLEGLQSNFKSTVEKITRFAFSQKASPVLIERGIDYLMRCPPKVLHGDYLACDRFDLMDEIGKIELPALIMCGEDDVLTPVKYSEFLHSRIKDSTLRVLPAAGHMVMLESPEAFNDALRAFVAGPAASAGS